MKTISLLINHHDGPTAGVLIGKNADGVWEFPNGTVRTNETEADACRRFAFVLLGIDMVPGKLTMIGAKHPQDGRSEHILCGNITHNTNTKCNSHLYWDGVNKWQTEPKAGAYKEYKWVHPSELAQYEFGGDDAKFMQKFDPWINPKFIPDVRML